MPKYSCELINKLKTGMLLFPSINSEQVGNAMVYVNNVSDGRAYLTTCLSFGTSHTFDDIVVDYQIPVWIRIGHLETTLENCPLYIEMQKYFKSLEQQVLIEKEKITISNEPIYAALFIAIFFLIAYFGLRLYGFSDAIANTMLLLFFVSMLITAILVIYRILQNKYFTKNGD